MKRRVVFISALMLVMLSVLSLGAQGMGGRGRGFMGGGPGCGNRSFFEDAEEVVLSGTIILKEDKIPLIKDKNVDYAVMIPPPLAKQIGLNDGDNVDIEGLASDGMISGIDFKMVHVRLITIEGETYNLFNMHPGFAGNNSSDFQGRYEDCPRYDDRRGNKDEKRKNKGSGKRW